VKPYRILVTGSRDWDDRTAIWHALAFSAARALAVAPSVVVVHGACQDKRRRLCGADAHADSWALAAQRTGAPVEIEQHPAENHGPWPACGPFRNKHMVDLGADEALAFIGPCTSSRCHRPLPHPSHGASHCAHLAEQAGIPVRRYTA